MAKFNFRDKLAQFWNATVGKIVPRFQVRRWADQSIDAVPVDDLASQLASGLNVGAWQQSMRENIKREVLRQYLAGRGGIEKMTQSDYGRCGAIIVDQYKYLDGFAREIKEGNLTEKQIAKRAAMYINSAREAFERAMDQAIKGTDQDEVRWVLDPSPEVEHCTGEPGCKELSDLGWQKIASNPFGGRVPGDGKTPCLTA